MNILNKGTDCQFNFQITDADGNIITLDKIHSFTLKFFTNDEDVATTHTITNGIMDGVTVTDSGLSAILNAQDTITWETGQINYIWELVATNTLFVDGFYNEVSKGTTDVYFKSLNSSKLGC